MNGKTHYRFWWMAFGWFFIVSMWWTYEPSGFLFEFIAGMICFCISMSGSTDDHR